jgi:hypothetical protein
VVTVSSSTLLIASDMVMVVMTAAAIQFRSWSAIPL